MGWGNQLHNEPTVGLTFERRWRTGRAVVIENPKLEVDFIPRAAVAVGNVATYGSVGGTARIGKNLRDDFGPTRARPALPGSDAFIGDGSFGWYLFAGVDGQAVARNIFLDGNTDGFSQRVSAPAVRRGSAGRIGGALGRACGFPTPRSCARPNSTSAIASRSSARST